MNKIEFIVWNVVITVCFLLGMVAVYTMGYEVGYAKARKEVQQHVKK